MLGESKAYTVTAITRMIKDSLEAQFPEVWVEGEISGYLHHGSGHRYFSLKDANAVLKGIIWRSMGNYLKFEPENGQKVRAYGNITVYERGGQYQLIVKKIEPIGVGPLEIAFRQLYEKLSKEGLFEAERKQPVPDYPRKVGIVTSPTGAAIRDIIQIARRRNDAVQLLIFPAQVQGEGAEKTIIQGIEYFNSRDDIDVIITGRGGGSLEDLWCFNTEPLVRAVVASRIPIISAVGHEIDTTLTDLAADLRAPTPSAAAELAVWSKKEFLEDIRGHLYTQTNLLKGRVVQARQFLTALMGRPVFKRPTDIVDQQRQFLDNLLRRLSSAGKNHFDQSKNRLSLAVARLQTLSPLEILQRGYSVTRHPSTGEVIKTIDEIEVGTEVETILAEGRILATVGKKRKDER